MSSRRLRVLVVEDSLTVRKRLCEVIGSNPEMEVLAEAEDGQRAIELCQSLRPDVVTLDMMLPVMSGLAATEYIMAYCPTPILVVSASVNRGELYRTYDALAAGALDVLEKPTGNEPEGEWERRFISTVKLVSRIKVITHPRARLGTLARPARPPESLRVDGSDGHRVVAIGASTGGPAAILDVLRALPAGFPFTVLVVLHIGEHFAAALGEWLDRQTAHRVLYPKHGDAIDRFAGQVVLAPADRHLAVRNGRLQLSDDAPRHSCRPSVDVLFESVAAEFGKDAIGCLLTGMGRDGAAGLLQMKRAGALTFAQDEASSVVYGMPREAILLGAATHVLPLSQIVLTLAELGVKRRGPR